MWVSTAGGIELSLVELHFSKKNGNGQTATIGSIKMFEKIN